MAANEWITSSEVLDSIENFKTKVWIYRNSEEDGSIVGFSSFATTGWQKCLEFLNADLIAAGLAPFAPETQAVRA
jgi:predicted ABC-type ATPase